MKSLIIFIKCYYYVYMPRKLRGTISLMFFSLKKKTILERFNETESLFIHIPKSAGIAIINSLYGEGYLLAGHLYFNELIKISSHPKNVIVFSRCPHDRLRSAYNFLSSGGINEVDRFFSEKFLSKYKSFDDFVMNGLDKYVIRNYMHFDKQINYILDVDKYKDLNLIKLKYENINDDYQHLIKLLGFGGKLEKLNVTKISNEKRNEQISDIVLEKIKSFYKEDYKEFDY